MQYGKFYIHDEAISLDYLKSKNATMKFVLVNFDYKSSIKIIPFYNTLKKKELTTLLSFFAECGINLRVDDLLGKLHIVILKILLQKDDEQVIIVNDVGFTASSIDFLLSNFISLKDKFKNRSIIVCSKLIY